jgi:HlyD family secretion protein
MVTSLNADFNSIVKKNQVIATIDDTIPKQQVRAEEINLGLAVIALEDAERQYKRFQELADDKLIPAQDLEIREVAYRNAKYQHENAVISLEKAKADLEYCVIKSPVDGVVVSRKADLGQTVTASMTTPELFIIAEDLSKMKLEVSIDEADITKVKVGQKANFTVDSLDDAEFTGIISQVRLEPVVENNVVKYPVMVEVENKTEQQLEDELAGRSAHAGDDEPPGSAVPKSNLVVAGGQFYRGEYVLRPGMTASVSIVTNNKSNVLRVPNIALRFNAAHHAPDASGPADQGGESAIGPGNRLWMLDERGRPVTIAVRVGLSDNNWTEVIGNDISEGMEILVGAEQFSKSEAANPLGL